MKYTLALFAYAVVMTYFAGFELYHRIEERAFAGRGYEIVTMVKLPDGVENGMLLQARKTVVKEQTDAIADVLKVHFPKVVGVN